MVQEEIVLLDGGVGQELFRRRPGPASPLWSAKVMAEAPDLVRQVHLDFIRAGARVITLNTYSATPKRLELFGDPSQLEHLHALALRAAAEAVALAPDAVRIAGCLSPLVASYRPELAPDVALCRAVYRRLVELQAPGVDLFMAETMPTIREAVAATEVVVAAGFPVWTALTLDDADGRRLRSGELLADAARAVIDAGAEAVMVNCSVPEAVSAGVAVLAGTALPMGAYANGFTTVAPLQPGLTVEALDARGDLGPEAYAEIVLGWAAQGAAIVGGCCEVGPAHIRTLHDRLVASGFKAVAALPTAVESASVVSDAL